MHLSSTTTRTSLRRLHTVWIRPRHRTLDPVRRSHPRRQSSAPSRGRSPTVERKRSATSQTTAWNTRENQAFVEDGQSCKPRQDSSHGGSLCTPPCTPVHSPNESPARRLPTIVPPVTFTVGPMEALDNLLRFTDLTKKMADAASYSVTTVNEQRDVLHDLRHGDTNALLRDLPLAASTPTKRAKVHDMGAFLMSCSGQL